jgi:beta-galactosidase
LKSFVQSEKDIDFNTAMSKILAMMKDVVNSEIVTKATAESFAVVDIAGYNYADSRYVTDKKLFPNRVICGSETYPKDIANNWKLVKKNGHVIGDFTWTGWDYLGEVGAGRIEYDHNDRAFMGNYPWLAAYCGDIDITGNRRPISYYREIVFGLRNQPYIAVQRPENYGKQPFAKAWSWSDSISSWTWLGFEGKPIKVEIYSDAQVVELLLNGKSMGKATVGEENDFKAIFDIVYVPGELKAIAYTGGNETGSMVLQSAGKELEIKMDVDRNVLNASGEDLAYMMISLTDEAGILQTASDRKVSITVEGSGTLIGFGNADPKSTENFFNTQRKTYDGKVLAVIRPNTESGTITVTASAEGCSPKTISVQVQ